MRRAVSTEDHTRRTRPSIAATAQQNATWDVRGSQVRSSITTAEMFFEGNRRGSNGVIPGQQLPEFPLPCLKQPVEAPNLTVQEEAHFNSSLNKIELGTTRRSSRSRIYDDPAVVAGYSSVPLLELDQLPRGGVSIDTQSVGRVQFGIPPETIKDSMNLGCGVPSVYIVPVERFCREMGPALGINLAEFEFPAYFNYFVRNKRCTLVVDSEDAENNIRRVFGETLLGPAQFRDHSNPKPNEDEDFDPSFPREARPNFYKEFYHFRTAEKSTEYQELTIDTLLEFCHFQGSQQGRGLSNIAHDKLGIPPAPPGNPSADEAGTADEASASRRHTFFSEGDDKIADALEDSHRRLTIADDLAGDDEDGESRPIRRTMSDPDVRKKRVVKIDETAPNLPESPGAAEPAQAELPGGKHSPRRGSMDSAGSFLSKGGRSRDGLSWASGASFMLSSDDEEDPRRSSWMYSQAKWLGEVATVYPPDATEEEKENLSCARLEIFKMAGGTEYIIHDINSANIIVGKAQIRGTVRVPDEIAVEGFHTRDADLAFDGGDAPADDDEGSEVDDYHASRSQDGVRKIAPPTFHPPSFGVTVLGNSHGFDKNGSVSGYVLWINGRGVMIDPPPYSSATLEREGIRPQMIMAIIITHCHADHDAGTFQKVMTGSRVAIITTPTIYKSFIRKYAALSGLSPTLLRHSHRHRPAIIGQPLKFQGATFYFTYTLHTIPCIAFRVEWRGRSMVFTGDHLNSPPMIDSLQSLGVLTKERADDLRRLPLQECDVLLHEAGAPPIHTPLSVLKELPDRVKKRLYVVHTSALPPESDLRVAPTGTAGTIRLDELDTGGGGESVSMFVNGKDSSNGRLLQTHVAANCSESFNYGNTPQAEYYGSVGSASNIWEKAVHRGAGRRRRFEKGEQIPLVFLRPTCVSDAWFILNLLSNVPFLSSLSYSNTMEVLEIAQVEMFCANEIVIPSERRSQMLCVVWEGTCVEQHASQDTYSDTLEPDDSDASMNGVDLDTIIYLNRGAGPDSAKPTVWHAGDWTGPVALQPDMERSAESSGSEGPKDVVALSTEGVKVIMLNMKDLHQILKSGSKLFRKYLTLKEKQAAEEAAMKAQIIRNETELTNSSQNGLHNPSSFVIDTVNELQSHNNWYAYDSVLEVLKCNSALGRLTALQKRHLESLAEGPRYFEAGHYLWQVGEPVDYAFLIVAGTATFAPKPDDDVWRNRRGSTGNIGPLQLQQTMPQRPRLEALPHVEEDKQLFNVPPNSEYARLEIGLQLRVEEMELDVYEQSKDLLPKEERMRIARDRFANKVLARLYSRRAYTAGLVFSRGHLLADTSRMVSGNLAHIHHSGRQENVSSMSHGLSGDHHCHTSNMVAGSDGCVVMVFPRSSLVQFLDGNPGVLLSLLGTQIVV